MSEATKKDELLKAVVSADSRKGLVEVLKLTSAALLSEQIDLNTAAAVRDNVRLQSDLGRYS